MRPKEPPELPVASMPSLSWLLEPSLALLPQSLKLLWRNILPTERKKFHQSTLHLLRAPRVVAGVRILVRSCCLSKIQA